MKSSFFFHQILNLGLLKEGLLEYIIIIIIDFHWDCNLKSLIQTYKSKIIKEFPKKLAIAYLS